MGSEMKLEDERAKSHHHEYARLFIFTNQIRFQIRSSSNSAVVGVVVIVLVVKVEVVAVVVHSKYRRLRFSENCPRNLYSLIKN